MRKKIYNNILELCGDTPLVRLNKIVSKDGANVFVKLEMFNPAGSIKDRIAFSMIEDAEKNGRLKSGGIIVESSSGNTGVGLAMAGAVKGYTVIVICDRYLPMAKKIKLLSFGAHIIFLYKTPKGSDTVELRLDLAKQIASMLPNGITLNQYDNLVNRETHYRTTGPEIVRDLDGKVNAVVCAVGTTGTLSGAGKAI
jgi:cysteine synthase A